MPMRQYRSCDACRKARIGCDAVRRDPGACSNCTRRSLTCTTTRKSQRQPHGATPAPQSSSNSPHSMTSLGLQSQLDRRQHALALHTMLWDIFAGLFETRLGLWIGSDCCPFKHLTTPPKTLISRLMVTLDDSAGIELCRQSLALTANERSIVNKALLRAVYAFSARWVITGAPDYATEGVCISQDAQDRLSDVLWHRAQQDMYPLLSRPSYRSSLALYLFGITPVAPQNLEWRFSDVCRDTSLKHLKELKGNSLRQSRRSTASPGSTIWGSSISAPDSVSQLLHMQDTAYWFGIVCDVSRCLLSGGTSVLLMDTTTTPLIWQLVEEQSNAFSTNHGYLSNSQLPLSEDHIFKVLCHGSASKTLVWWRIVEAREEMSRSGLHSSLQDTIHRALVAVQRFEKIFKPFIELFMRDYLLLKADLQVNIFLLVLHFHLGVLVFLDAVNQTADIRCTFPGYSTLLLNSSRGLINLVRTSAFGTDDGRNGQVLLLDPYPEHICKGLWYAGRATLDLDQEGILSRTAANAMLIVCTSGLSILQKVSFSAREKLISLRKLHTLSIPARMVQDASSPSALPSPVSVSSRTARLEGAENLADEVVADPNIINDTIERREKALGIINIAPFAPIDEPDWGQLDSFGQWEFTDCFATM